MMYRRIDIFIKKFDFQSFLKEEYFNYLVLTFTLIFGIYLNWSLKEIGGLLFLVYVMLWEPKSEKLAKGALYALALVPILLILRRETRAEEFAKIAYILLSFTILMAFWEMKKQKRG